MVDETNPPQSEFGDWVLMHVGFAMSLIAEEEAAKTLELLTDLGEEQRDMDLIRASSLN